MTARGVMLVRDPGRWIRSIRGRLILAYTASALATLVVAIGFVYWALASSLREEDEEVLASCAGSCRSIRTTSSSCKLLEAIRARWPRGQLVIVADNLSIHTHPNVKGWLARQEGRVRIEFLPLHASWVN